MSIQVWNTAPSDEMFEEIRKAAIEIWETYDNEFGYVDEKVNYIKSFGNVGSNYMTMWGMFDWHNQQKLLLKLKPETVKRIMEALK